MALPKALEDLEKVAQHAIDNLKRATQNFNATMATRASAAQLGVTGPGEPQKSQQGVNEYNHSDSGAPARTVATTQGPVETNRAELEAKIEDGSPPVGAGPTAPRRR
jgi:hypothetical protein